MDKSRFDRLHVKLFFAIAGAIAAMTFAAYLVFSWNFDRGFIDYINRADEARLETLADRLAEGYALAGNWEWITKDRDRWIEMSRDALGLPPRSYPDQVPTPPQARTERLPLTIDPRLLLFDADRQQLVGRPEAARLAVLKPITAIGTTVGYLGYVPRLQFLQSIESVYLGRQHLTFGALAIGMLLASLLLGAGLAYWLTRRIRFLARATDALIHGRYDLQLEDPGHDELAQLARDLNTLSATLAAAREARQQWIADIAHELRTPLAVLRAEIESLEDGVRPLDQAAVSSLAHEAARLARLVEDLRTLSLSDLGALTYHKEAVDLAEVVADTVEAQRRALNEHGLQFEMKLPQGATVLADAERLTQVFGNLLQNSLRYTEVPGKISIAMRCEGERVIVDWQDSNPEVPAQDLPRLTERLFRVEDSRSRMGGGSGLGLAIAKAIVEGHGGTLTARASTLGGLWMEIALPAWKGGRNHG